MTSVLFGLGGFGVPTLVTLACASVLAFLLGRMTLASDLPDAS